MLARTKQRRITASDAVVLGELRRQTLEHGHCSLSTRQFYELSGISRKTVQRSLSRLGEAGLARRVKAARGGASAHWVALPAGDWAASTGSASSSKAEVVRGKSSVPEVALMDPGKTSAGGPSIIPDAFRRSDLRSPWLLFEQLPEGRALSLDQVLTLSSTSSRRRTVEWWLLVLASMVPPLVDASSGERDCDWVKLSVRDGDLEAIARHLEDVATRCGGRRLHTSDHAQLWNQMEREFNLTRREARIA